MYRYPYGLGIFLQKFLNFFFQIFNCFRKKLKNLIKYKSLIVRFYLYKKNTCSKYHKSLLIRIYSNQFFAFSPLGDLQMQLRKFLCRTLCTEMLNNLIAYSSTSEENNLTTTESRAKVIKKLDQDLIEPFNKLNQSIASNDVNQLLEDADFLFEKLDLMIRKIDKRRENTILLENKHNLLKQLEELNDDHALILHLSVIILFNESYKCQLHASGKFVPQLISQLKGKLDNTTFNLLFNCEQLVVKQLQNEQDQEIFDNLKETANQVKQVATLLPKNIFVN